MKITLARARYKANGITQPDKEADMPGLTKDELQEELERSEDLIDGAASILTDDEASDEEKLARLEDLIFGEEAED